MNSFLRPNFRDMTEPELREFFDKLAKDIQNRLPSGPHKSGSTLFTLIVWDSDQITQYVSNAQRGDIIKALRETAAILERQGDVTR